MGRLLRAAGTVLLLAVFAPAFGAAQSTTSGTQPTAPPPTVHAPTSAGTSPSPAGSSGAATTGARGTAGPQSSIGSGTSATGRSASANVPDTFRNIRLGMTLDQVKNALLKDPYFDYTGPPDVSMLANPDENLIETSGYSFISRAFFQFYRKKLYIMILMLNPREISYYTMYTTLIAKYGPSTSLSPDEVVWESPRVRLSLERPLSVKYIDRSVFNRLKEAGKMKQSERSTSRDAFLNQF